HEAHVLHLEAVEGVVARLSDGSCQRAGEAARRAERRRRRQGTLECEHPHLGARVARRERLAVRPHAEHRVAPARVVLGHHAHPHDDTVLWVASVSCACAAGTNGRPVRNSRASAIASSWPEAVPTGERSCLTGSASTTPRRQPRSAAGAAQCRSSPQPYLRSGNGVSSSAASLRNAVTGPISTKRVSRTSDPGRRRVTRQAAWLISVWAGCASARSKWSASPRKRSRKCLGSPTSSRSE